MIAASTQERDCVKPNIIGNIFGANHCETSLPAARNAKEAPIPWTKFDAQNNGRVPEYVKVKLPRASKKSPKATTLRMLKRSRRYPAGICIKAKPRMKEPTDAAAPESVKLRELLIVPANTAPAVLRKNA